MGLPFILGTRAGVMKLICNNIEAGIQQVVLPCSLNDLASIYNTPEKKSIYACVTMCVPDGMPLVFWGRFALKTRVDRIYGPDLMRHVLDRYPHKTSLFIGPSDKTMRAFCNNSALSKKRQHSKNSVIVLPQSVSERSINHLLSATIEQHPSIIWVGISSPKQLAIATVLRTHHPKATIFCVGAAFDTLSGLKPRAPKIVQNIGMEWFFRLCTEPVRLWRRYLFEIPRFILAKSLDVIINRVGELVKKSSRMFF